MFGKQAGFWLAVAGVSLLSPVVLNLAADKAGHIVPGLRDLTAYTYRQTAS